MEPRWPLKFPFRHGVQTHLLHKEEEEINIYAVTEDESDEEGSQEKGGDDGQQKFIAHVPVPSQQEIEEALVRRKKMELLQKYASETLQAQSEEARRLLGY